ncbi:pericentrin [Microcaecilia unicolor]|uniref:Pericentrin-like n=1 Tax=Microcaecilia unicolor TaxID=1415580 RepID=A0A6P7YNA8_9AMPH|nr:pericentrin-like [Microcaecilia unicolor]
MKQLQETLLRREEELSSKANLQDPRKHVRDAEDFTKSVPQAKDKPKSFIETLINLSPWGSPDLMRKRDVSLERPYNFQGTTPYSKGIVIYSTDQEAMPAKSLALKGDKFQLQGYLGSCMSGIQYSKERQDYRNFSFSGSTYSIAESQDAETIHLEDRTSSSLPVPACGYGSYTISDLGSNLSQVVESSHLSVQCLAHLQLPEMDEDSAESANEMEVTELQKLSPLLQAALDMVHEESCNILACSEHPFICKVTPRNSQHSLESWQQERLNLLGIIDTLKEFLIKMIDKRHKDSEDTPCDWKGEILHSVQGLFEKEHIALHTELLPHFHDHSSGDTGSVMEKLEHIVKEQEGQQQLGSECILSLDRSSLLGEIQDLRAQLRMTQLRNQEKLQELQESVTCAEEHGSKREHQLRKQVELLEYKLQQEMSMVNDLQCSLNCQQEQLAEQFQHLKEEQNTTSNLRNELWNSKQELERLLSSHRAMQQEISRLSYTLEHKEQDLLAAVQSLQREHEKTKERIEQEQHQSHQEDQKENTVEDLKATLEEKKSLNKQLSIALEYEQASNINLRKELQIEYSRCEALLSHERSKLSDFQHILTLERQHAEDLAATVNYERTVLEQLTMKHQEQTSLKDQEKLMEQSFVQGLQAQLKEERKHTAELANMMEKTQQQTALAKMQAVIELQKSRDETKKEREFRKKLQSTLELLQRDRKAQLLIMREQEQQAGNDQEKQELQLQNQRDQQKIKELHKILIELEQHECMASSEKQEQENDITSKRNNDSELCFHSFGTMNLQKLEKARQQLLFIAIHLQKFVRYVADRCATDWSDEASMMSLLHTLEELKLELKNLSTFQKPLHDSAVLTDVLLLENEELTKSVTSLTEEKLKLQRERENLENNLQHYLSRRAAEEQVQRLYKKYLRAESYRKALIYPKEISASASWRISRL